MMKKMYVILIVVLVAVILAIAYKKCCNSDGKKTGNEPAAEAVTLNLIPLDSMKKYRDAYLKSDYIIKNDSAAIIEGIYIDTNAIKIVKRVSQQIDKKNHMGLRTYYGYKESSKEFGLVFAAVDSLDNDAMFKYNGDKGYIWEVMQIDTLATLGIQPKPIGPCPPICD